MEASKCQLFTFMFAGLKLGMLTYEFERRVENIFCLGREGRRVSLAWLEINSLAYQDISLSSPLLDGSTKLLRCPSPCNFYRRLNI